MKKFLLFFVTISLVLFIEIIPTFAQATIETGTMGIGINAYGRIRAYLPDATAGVKHIERISPLVGIGPDNVFDYQNDMDTEEPTTLVSNPMLSDFEIYGSYNNAYSSNPPDVLIKYNVYSWTNAKYALVKFTIINREANAINAKIGLDMIMSLDGTYGYDTVTYSASDQVIRTFRGGVNSGVQMLSHPLQSLYSFEWYDAYYADTSYWNWLNHGSIQNEYIGDLEGPVTIPSIDYININAGDSVMLYFSFGLGNDAQDLTDAMTEAQNKYFMITDVQDNFDGIPEGFTLEQNYPNPFNPSTRIYYGINSNKFVSLKVYDALGNEVATLVNEEKPAGYYEVDFNAVGLSSGVYFYKMQAGNITETRKMLLMK